MHSLRGQLLVSHPSLHDGDFRHTVVLVGEHDERGAVGITLNRPMNVRAAQAVPMLADLVESEAPVFNGGPVDPDEAVLVVETDRPDLLDVPVFGGIGFLTGDIPRGFSDRIRRARILVGHAGWGPGQLDAELAEGSWILDEARPDDVFTDAPELLWSQVLRRKGPEWEALARVPFDPRMN